MLSARPRHAIFFAIVLCAGCSPVDKKDVESGGGDSLALYSEQMAMSTYVRLRKMSIVGDFDGDGRTDTLFQNTISEATGLPLDSFPNQWDSMESYFNRGNANVILTISNRQCDTLLLGSGGGLYCLINMGDNNRDCRDEVALVVDNYGFTNISSCRIYTLCGNKWKELKSFKIHENAFEFEGDSIPLFKQIDGYLEQRNSKWFYIDYNEWFNAASAKDTLLKPLRIAHGC